MTTGLKDIKNIAQHPIYLSVDVHAYKSDKYAIDGSSVLVLNPIAYISYHPVKIGHSSICCRRRCQSYHVILQIKAYEVRSGMMLCRSYEEASISGTDIQNFTAVIQTMPDEKFMMRVELEIHLQFKLSIHDGIQLHAKYLLVNPNFIRHFCVALCHPSP